MPPYLLLLVASILGCTISFSLFLVSSYRLRRYLRTRFPKRWESVNVRLGIRTYARSNLDDQDSRIVMLKRRFNQAEKVTLILAGIVIVCLVLLLTLAPAGS